MIWNGVLWKPKPGFVSSQNYHSLLFAGHSFVWRLQPWKHPKMLDMYFRRRSPNSSVLSCDSRLSLNCQLMSACLDHVAVTWTLWTTKECILAMKMEQGGISPYLSTRQRAIESLFLLYKLVRRVRLPKCYAISDTILQNWSRLGTWFRTEMWTYSN